MAYYAYASLGVYVIIGHVKMPGGIRSDSSTLAARLAIRIASLRMAAGGCLNVDEAADTFAAEQCLGASIPFQCVFHFLISRSIYISIKIEEV